MRYTIADYFAIYADRWDDLWRQFLAHLSMTTASVLIALIVGVPLGIAVTRNKRAASIVIGLANVLQSVPSMALLALGIPLLGIGNKLAIFMVFVYALLPIIKNTYTGVAGISPVTVEVAKGIGLTPAQRLFKIELPMAVPYIMAGIRIAAVAAVGTMTSAAFAGAAGLGTFIQTGMNSRNHPMTLMGAVSASAMALLLDFVLSRIERAFTSEGLLPPEKIRNIDKTVRNRKMATAASLCAALIAVTACSYIF